MGDSQVLELLLQANRLKQTVRSGWQQRGVAQAESVAAHSFGTAFIALVMMEMIAEPIDASKVLAMTLLHDLPEVVTTDIPSPAWQYFPPGVKSDVQKRIMAAILGEGSTSDKWLDYWEELSQGESREARLVHDCDRLDMYVQALVYEKQSGNRLLAEFWEHDYSFAFDATRAVYNQLLTLRKQE